MGLFGISKDQAWEQFSNEINAKFTKGSFFKDSKVEYYIDDWFITLDTYIVSSGKTSTTYTRIRAPFINKDKLKFKIYRAGLFSEFGKSLGMQDIEIGHEYFDKIFIIKGNKEDKITELFSNDRVRRLTEKRYGRLEIKGNEGLFGSCCSDDEDNLVFSTDRIIKESYILKELFDLFLEILNELEIMGLTDKNKTKSTT